MTAIRNSQTKSTTHQRHHFDGAFCVMFRVQTWCKFGAKTYRTMRKICNDMRRKRHKIARNKRFSTIFRGVNASRKTPRDNYSLTAIISTYKELCFGRALFVFVCSTYLELDHHLYFLFNKCHG